VPEDKTGKRRHRTAKEHGAGDGRGKQKGSPAGHQHGRGAEPAGYADRHEMKIGNALRRGQCQADGGYSRREFGEQRNDAARQNQRKRAQAGGRKQR
jgi:hypothetical protein